MDNLTKKQRKKNMQNIRCRDTLPEKAVARELRRQKIYFASHVKGIAGKPDFVFRKKKIIIFVDSDFWHCHPRRFIMPKSNVNYWKSKIEYNRKRDKKVNSELKKDGWKVVRIWENDIRKNSAKVFRKIVNILEI